MSNFDDLINSKSAAEPKKATATKIDKPTFAEQKALKREKCYSIIGDSVIDCVSTAEKMEKLLLVESRFDKYSLNNNLLIYAQRPDASRLKDYKGWENDDKRIVKGGKSLMILEPHTYIGRDGEERTAFNPKLMFDIADIQDAQREPQLKRDAKLLVRALVNDCPVPIKTDPDFPTGNSEGAYYDAGNNIIVVRAGMTAENIFTAISYAMAHSEMAASEAESAKEDGVEPTPYRTVDHEFQARCVAFVLAEKYGIPSEQVSINSIPPKYAGIEMTEIKKDLYAIHKSVGTINDRMRDILEQSRQTDNKTRNGEDKGAR